MTNTNAVETPKTKTENKNVQQATEPTFSKRQIMNSQKYVNCRDALAALLDEDKTYSHKQVVKILETFYKGSGK